MIIDKDKVRMIMAKRGITMIELLESGDLYKNLFWKKREDSKSRPLTVHKLAKALGVEVEEILK